MLDINFLRENIEIVKAGAKKKNLNCDLDTLLALDDKRRILDKSDAAYAPLIREWHSLMLNVPNIPDFSVPDGKTEADNQELSSWGDRKRFSFVPRGHHALLTEHNMLDFNGQDTAFGYGACRLKNDGVRLSLALWQFTLDHFSAKGMTPLMPESLVSRENLLGTAALPHLEKELYSAGDSLYLSTDASTAVLGSFGNQTLEKAALPLAFITFSKNFTRVGDVGSTNERSCDQPRESYAWQQQMLCEARHEESVRCFELLLLHNRELLELLGIPYRVVLHSGGTMGLAHVKKVGIEPWMPFEERYRGGIYASYSHDFEARRLNIRYREEDGKIRYVHTLSNTALDTPRLISVLIENWQRADGAIEIPSSLAKYFGKDSIIKP